MSFLQKTREVVMGNLNELVDKTIDLNSIPVLKQQVRDLEDAIALAEHQTAVAAAQVTTLTRELAATNGDIEQDKKRAQAFLAINPPNEVAARVVASRIADHRHTAESLTAQVATAKQQSETMSAGVEKMRAKHDFYLNRVRTLQGKDQMAKALDKSTAAIKSMDAALGSGIDGSVDDVARRVDAHADLAQEEFSRLSAKLDGPEDPLKKQAVDDVLNELKGTPTAA